MPQSAPQSTRLPRNIRLPILVVCGPFPRPWFRLYDFRGSNVSSCLPLSRTTLTPALSLASPLTAPWQISLTWKRPQKSRPNPSLGDVLLESGICGRTRLAQLRQGGSRTNESHQTARSENEKQLPDALASYNVRESCV